ncbi:MAG: helix-turn-helix transcriptional regulator [Lyngbya sp.]|nr:helix-turn-helix transcriptional regulator [Lyngbya sp.]
MNNQPRKQLGINIRKLRIQQELSQEKLAEKADLHRTYIGAIERGERNVSLDNIVAIAHALGVSASQLLEGVD